jgi:hypothetical protein
MPSSVVVDRFGRVIELDEGEEIPDGHRVVVSATFMDSGMATAARLVRDSALPRIHDGLGGTATLGHRPGYAFLDLSPREQGAREDLLQRHKEQLAQAWRNPTPQPVADDESVDDARRKRRSRWAQLEFAQRTSGQPRRPPARTSDDAYAQRKAALASAWKNP